MPHAQPTHLTLAHSPDPDDVFMWWPITGMIDPADPARVLVPPALDTGRFAFRAFPADIDVLNRRAVQRGDLDITAISINTYPYIKDRYALTRCGASMGYGYGPKVVVRGDSRFSEIADLAQCAQHPQPLVAVPGVKTTAFLVFSLQLGRTFRYVEMPFDQILPAVAEGRADAGLLIHQSQLTFADLGLRQLTDVGAWWLAQTGLPLPLGGNALRRDLDSRFGLGTLEEITAILDRSIRYALDHRDRSIPYAMRFAPEITREQAERYIDMYVSDLTIDAGERGLEAIRRLLSAGHRAGLSPDSGEVVLITPADSRGHPNA